MDKLKEIIKGIIKYAMVGVIISVIVVIICLIFDKAYSNVLRYVALAVMLIGALGVVGSLSGIEGINKKSYNIDYSEVNNIGWGRTAAATYRCIKLFLTAFIIYSSSLI